MNNTKFLILIIIVLLVMNGFLFFRLIKPRKEGAKSIIIEQLHLDKEQIKKYESYIRQHRQDVNENEAKMNALRSNLFEQLKYDQNFLKVDSLISIIAQQQMVAEKINYNHFLEVKGLCKPSQKEAFNELTTEIAHLFSPKKGRK